MASPSLEALPTSTSSHSLRRLSLPNLSTPLHTPPLDPSRQTRSSTKTPLSVQLFQERHASQFPHLYQHADPIEHEELVQKEVEALEEARRLGRILRESMMAPPKQMESGKVQPKIKGRRPLSLVMNQQLGLSVAEQGRISQCAALELPLRSSLAPPSGKEHLEYRTPDLSTPKMSDLYTPEHEVHIVTPRPSQGLGMEFASPNPSSLPENASSSSAADTSIQRSTYSWASSFSGETEDLRLAARYVPNRSQDETQPAEEETLDTPEKTNRRRKRIVAIAHTARQLEGVGSREVEDPLLYQKLLKAWNERPGFSEQEIVWTPDESSTQVADSYLAQGIGSHCQPKVPIAEPSPALSEEPVSHASTQSSGPFRYSFASSAHDLVDEQGLERGAQILSEKAWLKTPLYSQKAYFGAHSPSAPFPLSDFQPHPRGSVRVSEGSVYSVESVEEQKKWVGPQRKLRRVQTDISNIKAEPSRIPLKSDAPFPTLGLGFIGNWMIPPIEPRELSEEEKMEQDFHHGEDRAEIREAKIGIKHSRSIHSISEMVLQDQQPVEKGEESLETIDLTLGASRPASYHRTPEGRKEYQRMFQEMQRPNTRVIDSQSLNHSQQPDYWIPSITSLPQNMEYHHLAPPIELGPPIAIGKNSQETLGSEPEMEQSQASSEEKSETEEGEWVEDSGSYHSSENSSSLSKFQKIHPQPPRHDQPHHHPNVQGPSTDELYSWLEGELRVISSTTPRSEEEEGPVFPDMLNTPGREAERRDGEPVVERERGDRGSVKRRPQSCGLYCFRDMLAESGGDGEMERGQGETETRSVGDLVERGEAGRGQTKEAPTQANHISLPPNYDPEKALPPQPRSRTPKIIFFLGFLLPFLWIIGGWFLPSPTTASTYDTEAQTKTHTRHPKWIDHPNPSVVACRYASLATLSALVVLGIILAIVLPLAS